MSHAVENMAYAGETPWHGLGFKVDGDLTPEEMVKAAKLDWTVSKRKLWMPGSTKSTKNEPTLDVPGYFALTRDTDNQVMSIVGKGYKPVQNAEAMDFFSKFVKAGHMTMETAGSLHEGRYIWGLAKIGKGFNLSKSDRLEGYLLMMQPHIANMAMVFKFTPIRVVCWNTLSCALGASFASSGRIVEAGFRMPHSRTFNDETRTAAEQALGLSLKQLEEFKEISEKLSKTKLTDVQASAYFYDVVKVAQDAKAANDTGARVPVMVAKFTDALTNAPGQKLNTAKGTAWGALNAVTYVVDHEMGRSRDIGLRNAWLGDSARVKNRALDLALKIAA